MKQIPLSLGPEPEYTFDTLLAGANVAALSHLLALGAGAPPVFLWGPPGCGKTHALRALAQRWQAAGAQVGWYDADTPLPWELPANPSLLLLDDCQRFDAGQQHAAFALFVEAATLGLPVVAAYCANALAGFAFPRGIERLVILADHDPAGQQAAATLAQRATRARLTSKTLTPSKPGSDWADVWLEGMQ